MKFSVSSRELLRILKATGAVILRKNSLPILADHLFTRDGDKFFITGSSQENSLTMPIGITLDNGSDFQPFCLLAVDIIPLLGALPEQPITVEVDMSNHIAKIIYQSGQVSVPVEDSAEYPRVSDVKEPKTSFDIEANIFFPAVKAANGCTAIDSTLRPQMSAVALDVQDEGVVFVGSDGHSLYKYSYQHGAPFLTGSKVVILIPNTIAGQLQAPFAGVETLTIQHDGKHVCLKAGDITFTIRDIEQKYPNYNSVIPKNSPYHATLPVAALAGAAGICRFRPGEQRIRLVGAVFRALQLPEAVADRLPDLGQLFRQQIVPEARAKARELLVQGVQLLLKPGRAVLGDEAGLSQLAADRVHLSLLRVADFADDLGQCLLDPLQFLFHFPLRHQVVLQAVDGLDGGALRLQCLRNRLLLSPAVSYPADAVNQQQYGQEGQKPQHDGVEYPRFHAQLPRPVHKSLHNCSHPFYAKANHCIINCKRSSEGDDRRPCQLVPAKSRRPSTRRCCCSSQRSCASC